MSDHQFVELSDVLKEKVEERARLRFQENLTKRAIRVDRLFAQLMAVQFFAVVAIAMWWTPKTWIGLQPSIHIHVTAAISIGLMLTGLVCAFACTDAGNPGNAIAISISQVIVSALLIHLCGGRIETHFHVFGSLAFLAQYKRFEVLIVATVLIAADHALRGFLWPVSIFGVVEASSWRWLEHGGWVFFEVIVLLATIRQSREEIALNARGWALLSINKEVIDAEVQRKTDELAQQRKELQSSENRLRHVIDTAYDAYMCVDQDLEICDWSRRAETLVGWSRQDVVGRPCSLLQLNELEQEIRRALADGKLDATPSLVETSAITSANKSIPVDASYCVSSDGDSPTTNVFLRDTTERRHNAARQLHQHKMESIGQLAAGIAHEINTPSQFVSDNLYYLQSAFGQLESLLNELTDSPQGLNSDRLEAVGMRLADKKFLKLRSEVPKAIEQSIEGLGRISTLTSAMKNFSHPGQVKMQPADLNTAIENTINVCRNEWKYVADVVTDFDRNLPLVHCLASELNQVWINMVVNAAHAIAEVAAERPNQKGTIRISTRRIGETVEVSVSDNGCGIKPENRDKIFEPFFTTKDVGKGTGQGLAISHSVIAKHQGNIRVESEVGKGTAFIITLALTHPEPAGIA